MRCDATLGAAVSHRVAARLGHPSLPAELVARAFHEAVTVDPGIGQAFRADIGAVIDRDPATLRALEPVLYFKGFHALQAYRLAHHVWHRGRRDLALYLQSRISEVFQCDIHPAAKIGRGVFLDHATGPVVGSTAVIEDDVSILHAATLGGTGKQRGDRHPKIRRGLLIGARPQILGNIAVGACARAAVPRSVTSLSRLSIRNALRAGMVRMDSSSAGGLVSTSVRPFWSVTLAMSQGFTR